MKAITTEKLTKYYGKARGIIDVDMCVDTGDFYGFIGPNGAGKSTTIRTLLGLISPSSGGAQIFGKDICSHRTEILTDLGYLPSETMFYPSMKVAELLRFSAKMRNTDCTKQAESLCKRLELDTSKRICELSFGNRKKVGIVCALQHEPKLYILDEPTSGLDPLMQREFYSILEERNRSGATVFLSSHILSEVARYCKHAAVIKEGKIIASDSVEKLAHTGIKRVTLRGASDIPSSAAIRNIKTEQGTTSFLFSGEPSQLLSILSSVSFDDFCVTDPDLEEVFMHYYSKEEK